MDKSNRNHITGHVNRNYKDRLFRCIFKEKQDLLDLYNAINGTQYGNPNELEITTLEDVVYLGMKNDLSFIIDDIMNLYEHQSSFNPNMALRGLVYFAELYRKYILINNINIYGSTKIKLPVPQYIVFYNGSDEEPDRKEIRLTELFYPQEKVAQPAVECIAVMLNINYGHNLDLMEKCRKLKEYAYFIRIIREYLNKGDKIETAVNCAIEICIQKEILKDILQKNRSEVLNVILTEFDENLYSKSLREEGREEGIIEGKKEGKKEGMKAFIELCQEIKISKDETRNKLIEKFKLQKDVAEEYLIKYWK